MKVEKQFCVVEGSDDHMFRTLDEAVASATNIARRDTSCEYVCQVIRVVRSGQVVVEAVDAK